MQKRRKKTSKEERVCPICAQGFNKAEHLMRHIRSHTKEKPFRCSVCDRVFVRQDTLLRHRRSHPEVLQEPQDDPHDPSEPSDVVDESRDVPSSSIEPIRLDATTADAVAQLNPDLLSFEMTPTLDTIAMSDSAVHTSPGTEQTLAVASTLPTEVEDGVRQSDLMPYWGLEVEAHWPDFGSLLANNYMDIDGINSAFVNATGNHPTHAAMEDVAMTPTAGLDEFVAEQTFGSEDHERLESKVQRSWHTYCRHAPSGYVTPDPGQEHLHVDEDCHKKLADRLQPRLQHGILPSVTFLDLCVQAYFTNFHLMLPIIHAPTFRPHSQNGLLLLSICSLGSLFLGSPRATSHGINLFERLNKAILASWDSILVNSGSANHIGFQASIIGQMFGMLVGRPRDLIQVELFHGTLVAWGRKLKLFQLKSIDVNVAEVNNDELEVAWKTWIRQEEKKRTMLALLLLDAEIARLFHHEPIINYPVDRIPCTSSNEAFAARNPTIWKRLMTENGSSGALATSTPVDARFPKVLGDFGLHVMLQRIESLASGERETNSLGLQASNKCRTWLISWLEKYRHTRLFRSQAASLMMLWHSAFMVLDMDLDALECAAGREGDDTMKTHRKDAEIWARSPQMRSCMVHAILVQRQFEQLSLGTEPPIHAPMCLYRCGMAWYCYTRFGDGKRLSSDDRGSMPELDSLGIDGSKILLDEVGCQVGKPPERFILRTIDLLQRIRHWKIADKFACTLTALVDDGRGLF